MKLFVCDRIYIRYTENYFNIKEYFCWHFEPNQHYAYWFLSGFKEQIYDVYRYLPPGTQVILISATLPHEILEMTSKFMTDPIRILVKR